MYATPNFSVFEEDYKTTKEIGKSIELDPTIEIIVYQPLVHENKIVITDLINNKIETFDYLYFENKSKIVDTVKFNWELINEKQIIDKIECYKAVVDFRGRKWIAWYAPSIPLSYGPWKLHGLPGLILEANDIDFKYHYLMTSIEFNKNEFAKIPIDKSIKEVTMKEFLTIKDDFYNTPKDFGRDMLDTSKKHNFLNREIEFEFPIKFKWEE